MSVERQTVPSRRRSIWLWVAFILLVVLIGCVAFLLIRIISERPAESARTVASPAPLATSNWEDQYCFAGVPRTTSQSSCQVTVLTNTAYLVGYSETRKDPVWVCYRLFKPDSFVAPPRPKAFEPDYRTISHANSHDYTGSGYDRGHMAPNYAIAVCYGAKAQQETFLMSNIIPQSPHLNRQVWEHLEQTEIKEYAKQFGQVWVMDGPIFHHRDHLQGGEDIPDACWKIIVREIAGTPQVLAFIMPQNVAGTESPQQFLTSVREIEKETGLDFFSSMPTDLQQRFETVSAKGMW